MQAGTVSAILGGAAVGLNKTTGGTVTLSGANTYTGTTAVNAGTLALGASNVLADTSSVVVNGGTVSITNRNDTVAGVQLVSGSITGTTGVLTSTSAYDMQAGTVSAILGGAAVGLNKTTAGTVILSGANTYAGATTVGAGTLIAGERRRARHHGGRHHGSERRDPADRQRRDRRRGGDAERSRRGRRRRADWNRYRFARRSGDPRVGEHHCRNRGERLADAERGGQWRPGAHANRCRHRLVRQHGWRDHGAHLLHQQRGQHDGGQWRPPAHDRRAALRRGADHRRPDDAADRELQHHCERRSQRDCRHAHVRCGCRQRQHDQCGERLCHGRGHERGCSGPHRCERARAWRIERGNLAGPVTRRQHHRQRHDHRQRRPATRSSSRRPGTSSTTRAPQPSIPAPVAGWSGPRIPRPTLAVASPTPSSSTTPPTVLLRSRASGAGFLYSVAPSITPSLTGTVTKVYDGTTTATLTPGNYVASGAIDGDTVNLSNLLGHLRHQGCWHQQERGRFWPIDIRRDKRSSRGLRLPAREHHGERKHRNHRPSYAHRHRHGGEQDLRRQQHSRNNQPHALRGDRRRHRQLRRRHGHLRRQERGCGQDGDGHWPGPRRHRRSQLHGQHHGHHHGGHHGAGDHRQHHRGEQDLRRQQRGDDHRPYAHRRDRRRHGQLRRRHGDLRRQERGARQDGDSNGPRPCRHRRGQLHGQHHGHHHRRYHSAGDHRQRHRGEQDLRRQHRSHHHQPNAHRRHRRRHGQLRRRHGHVLRQERGCGQDGDGHGPGPRRHRRGQLHGQHHGHHHGRYHGAGDHRQHHRGEQDLRRQQRRRPSPAVRSPASSAATRSATSAAPRPSPTRMQRWARR